MRWTGWAVLAWSMVGPVYVAWTLWSWASARAGVARTNAFMFLVPLVGGAASVALTGEGMGPVKLLGAAVVLAGLALMRAAPGDPAAASSAEGGRSGTMPDRPVGATR